MAVHDIVAAELLRTFRVDAIVARVAVDAVDVALEMKLVREGPLVFASGIRAHQVLRV